jgi:hypothetical protein
LQQNYLHKKSIRKHKLGPLTLLQVKSCFAGLIKDAKTTEFGIDHHFDQIKTFEDFAEQVPIRDYEDLKPYVEKW